MQQVLKAFVRPARAWVVAAELFDELFVSVDNAHAAFHVRLGREASSALTGSLESKAGRDGGHVRCVWDTSGQKASVYLTSIELPLLILLDGARAAV
jgi:hypothetical protein